jgi:energy-coupling factor transport system permease protein
LAAAVEYIPGDSLVHRLNPLTKILWTLFILVAALLFSDYRYLLALLASVLAAAAAAGIIRQILAEITGLLVFALILFTIQALFYDLGEPVFYLVAGGRLPVTNQGLLSGLAMAARMMTLVLSFLVFTATTRTQDIVLILVEKIKIPYDYAFMFITALRFIPTFLGEVRQVSQAQQARGHAVEGINPFKKIRAYAPVTVPLVLISLNKAEQLAMAMETRGFGGGPRTYLRDPGLGAVDYCLIALLALALTLAIIARISGYGVIT